MLALVFIMLAQLRSSRNGMKMGNEGGPLFFCNDVIPGEFRRAFYNDLILNWLRVEDQAGGNFQFADKWGRAFGSE